MLSKDSASRKQNKINLFIFYVGAKPMLSKDSANRKENKISLFIFYVDYFFASIPTNGEWPSGF